MAFITKLSNFFCSAAIKEPTGVWEKIIMAFHNGIPNYAWAIIVFTIVVKLVIFPLDFVNRRISAKNAKVQALVQPEIEDIQKKYGNNKQMLNQKTMEIYKKHNYNVTGSCVIMLVYMALTLFIFITLFSGLNNMAAYKVGSQYQEMENAFNKVAYETEETETDYEKYTNAFSTAFENKKSEIRQQAETQKKNEILAGKEEGYELTDEDKAAITKAGDEAVANQDNINLCNDAGKTAGETASGKTLEEIMVPINDAVAKRYNEVKNSWLWVDNVWKSDVPWKKSSTTFDEFVSLARITYKDSLGEGEEETFNVRLSANKEADRAKYDLVMSAVESENRVNGYLIIPIVAVAVNVLSMLASQGKLKFKRKKKQEGEEKSNKMPGGILMLVLLPALMGYITLSYNTVFGLYILVGSLFSLATTPLVNFGIKKWDELDEKRKAKKQKKEISYKR